MNPYLKFTLGFLAVFATSYFSAWLATRRTFKERWWERKQKAYTDIIEALYDLLSVSESKFYEVVTGVDLNEGEKKELENKRKDAYLFVSKAIDLGGLTISKSAIQELKNLRKGLNEARKNQDYSFIHDDEMGLYQDTIENMIKHARKDLKI